MKTFPKICMAECSRCGEFLYIPGLVNSVTSRNSDIHMCPKCPTCGSPRYTRQTGVVGIHVWSVRKV